MPIQFFGQPDLHPIGVKYPLRILFLTSVRDVVGDDQNGQFIQTPGRLDYMMGVPEFTIRHTRMTGELFQLVEVVGIVTDDTAKDCAKHNIAALPEMQGRWLVPAFSDLGVPTINIPSNFRLLSLSDIEGRRKAKRDFEGQVLDVMGRLGADVLVSDHYMAKLEFVFPPHLQFGRALNIHPAPTVEGHEFCFRGKTPTADAIALAARSNPLVFTGATLHVMDPEIDHGPALAFATDTRVFASDDPMALRYRNYQASKLPVFVHGLKHYVLNIFPHLDGLDLTRLVQMEI